MKQHYDIAIIGGGMVGASLAVSLLDAAQQLSLNIAVFEAYPLPEAGAQQLQPSYDARSTALSYGSRELLQRMNVWQSLSRQVSPIHHIRVSDRGHFGAVRLDAKSQGVPALGYVVENRWLGQVLLNRLAEAGGQVDLHCPAEVLSAEPHERGMTLQLDMEGESQSITAELVVMADGGRSLLRERLGIDYQQSDYQQCAVIANVSADRPHRGIAYERFTAAGPMALLPLTDDAESRPRSALVWSLPLERADEVLNWSDQHFLSELQRQFGYRAGAFQRLGERHCYPLKLTRAREQVRQGLVVLGNAAHTLHPIAGQGFNLALRGALALAEELVSAAEAGRPLGALSTLNRFNQKLDWDQQKTIGFSDQVTRLFSTDRQDAVCVRTLGMLAMDLLPPIKGYFSRSAMGQDVASAELSVRNPHGH